MSKLLRLQEAAELLGVSADTLRRWEEDGMIAAYRTPGGQRRYREDELIEALEAPSTSIRVPKGSTEPKGPPATAVPAMRPWEEHIQEAEAHTRILQTQIEREELRRQYQERQEALEREREEQRCRLDAERAEAAQRKAAQQQEVARLDALRAQGAQLASGAPTLWQAKVKRDLLSYVTAERFPPQLDQWEARELLQARVTRILRPWQDEQTCADLMRAGNHHAWIATLGSEWDRAAAAEARHYIETVLKEEVTAQWTRLQVIRLVDELLEEWE